MEYYKNYSGTSGIQAFEYTSNGILIEFKNGSIYEYTNYSAGSQNIEKMKLLARSGTQLNRFIKYKVNNLYSRKLKQIIEQNNIELVIFNKKINMIKVKTEKYKAKFELSYMNDLSEATINPLLESIKLSFIDIFKDFECERHLENSKGTIVIDTNNSEGKMNYKLNEFCCREFKNEIQKNLSNKKQN